MDGSNDSNNCVGRFPSPPLTPLEKYLAKERDDKRVLSIQSHVVSGFVGNKCAVFPLQLHGFEVDSINSVQFSNHTLYPNVRGQLLDERDLANLFEGIRLADLTSKYSHILTGYCGDASFLRQIAAIIRECRRHRPGLVYVCDPVMGDNGKYYNAMSRELCAIYRDEILPLADVITPNAFELSELSGFTIANEADCLRAIANFHRVQKVRIVVMTSGLPDESKASSRSTMYCYASETLPLTSSIAADDVQLRQFRFEIPLIAGTFVGTGDLFAALLLAWLEESDGDLCRAVKATIASMQSVIGRTSDFAFAHSTHPTVQQRELRLMQSRLDLLRPKENKINYIELHNK
uniref:Pyridoxal kinase n=1 Tax=Globodera rostochiensis TaxID=31243 RepID=A0A914HPX6_GLORO